MLHRKGLYNWIWTFRFKVRSKVFCIWDWKHSLFSNNILTISLKNCRPTILENCSLVYLWKRYVYWTTFSNVIYQDLCATINLSKIKYLQNRKQSLKYLCNINLIGFLQKPDLKRKVPYNSLTFYPNRVVRK